MEELVALHGITLSSAVDLEIRASFTETQEPRRNSLPSLKVINRRFVDSNGAQMSNSLLPEAMTTSS